MPCSLPPPLSDEQIYAVLSGDTPAGVQEHLDQCPDCREYLERELSFERRLTASLHRWDCPPPAKLGDYHLGLLAGTEDRAIAGHLALCVRCAQEIEDLRLFLTADTAPQPEAAPEPTARPRAQVPRLGTLVARLMPARPGLGQASFRGATRGPQIAQSSAATIVLDPVPDASGQIQIVGQIADELDDQDRWTGAVVEARQEGAFVALAVVDDLGSFACGPLPASPTELSITAEGGPSIIVERLEL